VHFFYPNRARDGSGYAAKAASMLFRPAKATSRKPHARAGAGKRRRSPRKKQRAGKPHLSGQPGPAK